MRSTKRQIMHDTDPSTCMPVVGGMELWCIDYDEFNIHKQQVADIMAWSFCASEFRPACSNTILLEINITRGKEEFGIIFWNNEFGIMNHFLGGLLKIKGRSYRHTYLAMNRQWEEEPTKGVYAGSHQHPSYPAVSTLHLHEHKNW